MTTAHLTEAIILNYRKNDMTLRCIESLIGQVPRIWVVDNSQDKQCQQEFASKVDEIFTANRSIRIEILIPERNLGFAKGIQFAIDCALKSNHLESLLLINNDALARQGMVEHMQSALTSCNNMALIAARQATNFSAPSMLWHHRYCATITKKEFPGSFPYLTGACLLVPIQFARPFLLDPDFFMYGEDVELSWRLARAGIPLVIADAMFEHLGSASSRIGSAFYEYHVVRGHILLTKKITKHPFEYPLLLVTRSLMLTCRAALRTIRFKSFTPFHAYIQAWRGTPPPPPSH